MVSTPEETIPVGALVVTVNVVNDNSAVQDGTASVPVIPDSSINLTSVGTAAGASVMGSPYPIVPGGETGSGLTSIDS